MASAKKVVANKPAKAKPTKAKPTKAKPAATAARAPKPAKSVEDGPLATALALWRGCPCDAFAQLVVRAGALAGGDGRPAISGLDLAERDAMWHSIEKAHDPADLDRLLATLVDGRCEQAMARIDRLAAQPRDPRFLTQLLAYISADPDQSRGETSPVPFTSGPNRKFWTRMFELVDDLGDAATAARVEPVAAREPITNFQTWLQAKIVKTAAALRPRTQPTPSAADAAAAAKLADTLARAEAEQKPSADTGDALYAAVWAAPDDDAPRLVLADFLTERADPRGEFITLQLARAAGTLDADGKKREKELLKRHKKLWLGPIGVLIQLHHMRFERGFLCTCFLEPNEELEKTLVAHPAWSTIREYYVHHYAKGTAQPIQKTLAKYGAREVEGNFTRGIE